jgi:hypothetical protein
VFEANGIGPQSRWQRAAATGQRESRRLPSGFWVWYNTLAARGSRRFGAKGVGVRLGKRGASERAAAREQVLPRVAVVRGRASTPSE